MAVRNFVRAYRKKYLKLHQFAATFAVERDFHIVPSPPVREIVPTLPIRKRAPQDTMEGNEKENPATKHGAR